MKLELLTEKNKLVKSKGALLFIHGASHGAWCWKKYMQYFSQKGFDCYALSLRGHGKSDGYENLNDYGLDDYVKDILNVLKKIPAKPVLIGHSMGGILTQKIIQTNPEKIKAAVIIASIPLKKIGLLWVTKFLLKDFKGGRITFDIFLGKKVTEEELSRASFINGRLSEKELVRCAPLIQAESKKALKEIFRLHRSEQTKSKLPVFLLGSKADKLFSPTEQKKLVRFYKKTPILLSDMCHDMMLDFEWEKGAREILRFLKQETM
ncbi:MAG TPA: alpha/beta hydrolase [Candidatus Moranbacteria bacterium]|nr:alpha/beta hydrolase [Candidatus Moranbacteria bacterium]